MFKLLMVAEIIHVNTSLKKNPQTTFIVRGFVNSVNISEEITIYLSEVSKYKNKPISNFEYLEFIKELKEKTNSKSYKFITEKAYRQHVKREKDFAELFLMLELVKGKPEKKEANKYPIYDKNGQIKRPL